MISAAAASISIEVWIARAGAVEELFVAAEPARQHRGAHHQQDVADDRADDRGADHFLQPLAEAKRAMISSGALPKVTLRRPPMPGPERAANSSVARPISAAVGMIPSAEAAKTTIAETPAMSRITAIGISGASRYG